MSAPSSAGPWPRLGWGATLLTAPRRALEQLADMVGPADPDPDVTVRVMRVLGARHVLQGLAELIVRRSRLSGPLATAAATVDVLHVASLPAVALLANPAQRRLLALDAPVEAALATRQVLAARQN